MDRPIAQNRTWEMLLLGLISSGLIMILLSIIWGLFLNKSATLPNWAENVLVAIATASALKLGDCLSTLVALANGRSVENFGSKLADSQPSHKPSPQTAVDAAVEVADAANNAADKIEGIRP